MNTLQLKRLTRTRLSRAIAMAATTVAIGASIGGASVVTSYTTNPIVLTQPTGLSGANALPYTGVTAGTFSTSATYSGTMTVAPYTGLSGDHYTISGSGMPANTTLQLVWKTSNATWVADVEPNTVNYLGDKYTSVLINLATVTTDANGAFSYSAIAPVDFGGTHDIYAVQNAGDSSAAAVGHGGYQLLRKVTISPTSGPVGTPITVTYTSLGASLYAGGGSLLYDNHYTGALLGHWTRGTATAVIRASGAPGKHFIQVGDAISYLYMNIIQSPLAYVNGGSGTFTVTPSNTVPAPSITWPSNVNATVDQFTTFQNDAIDSSSSAAISLSTNAAPVLSKVHVHVTGLTVSGTSDPSSGAYNLVWATVAGSRVNCTSTCWTNLTLPLANASASAGTLDADVTIPNHLGGFHVIEVVDASGNIEAEKPFYVKESIKVFKDSKGKTLSLGVATSTTSTSADALAVGQSGTGTYTLKENQEFTISMLGVGWTQFDNTLAVDYDNSYIGYGCGFNSNGYMVVHLFATGGPGIHIIDLHPLLYTQMPSFANTPYGMVPFLTSQSDDPALALGYQVPTVHFAIKIVK